MPRVVEYFVAITQNVACMERQFNACQTSRSMYPSIFSSFRVIQCLSQCVQKSLFYHIFVFPGDAPGAITLNVVWTETEFAYKLSRWMCPSNYNRFSDRARYWWINRHFLIAPLHSTPPLKGFPTSRLNIATPFGIEKLEWLGYQMVKKFRRYLYSFWRDPRTWRTHGHRVTAYTALMHMHRAVKND